ncbi:MAG: molybdopterin oxidoreductase family protein, partial [Balneolaceae bacterium]
LDLGLRTGPYGAGFLPFKQGLTLRKLKKHPHGIDLGPLKPLLPERLFTPGKRIHAAPETLVCDVARVKERLLGNSQSEEDGFGLLLIGRRQLRSNNSWMHNYARLMRGRNRCTLLIHPVDAETRGLKTGTQVRLLSRAGNIEVPVEVSGEMMPGVVSLPHGWGHDQPGIQVDVARAHAGVSVNDVTDDQSLDALSGNAVLNGVPVRIERIDV